MRKSLVVGILPESKNIWERRAPLTPRDVAWLVQRGIAVEVISSPLRIFPDELYKNAGAHIVRQIQKATLLLGIKEPGPEALLAEKIYCVFSHATKGQVQNRPLLREALKRGVTLLDYEHIEYRSGKRVVYFGRFAGICGMMDSLHYLGKRLENLGVGTPFLRIKKALDYGTLARAKRHLIRVRNEIKEKGFPQALTPLIIGITGHGNVAHGAREILDLLGAIEIHPKDMEVFVHHQRKRRNQIYKIVFTREEKLRAKDRSGFYFEDYLEEPTKFESNLDQYLPFLCLLIHGSYWDRRYPRLVTEKMIKQLYQNPLSRLIFIGDLTCDVRGAIEITRKVTNPDNPVFLYDPSTGAIRDGLSGPGIAILAVDNLPAEFSKDATEEFSGMMRDYVYQMASHGVTDITNHHALPVELRNAVICQGGELTRPFRYLKKYLS